MKKLYAIGLTAMFVLAATACSDKPEKGTSPALSGTITLNAVTQNVGSAFYSRTEATESDEAT